MRASYARYYQQLAFGDVTRENPTAVGYIAYGWNDGNGDRFVQPGEIVASGEVRMASDALGNAFGRNDLSLRTDDGRVLSLRFSGKRLAAESAVLVSTVLGREERAGEEWLYLDVGVYNGLMETQQMLNEWEYPLWSSLSDHASARQIPFTIAGPSCDSADTMFLATSLPASIGIGDHVMIGSTGAYTLSYASAFNGFPPPTAIFV